MTRGAGSIVGAGKTDPTGLPDRDVLVLTDGQRGGYELLGLPFREARVLEPPGDVDGIELDGRCSAILVDRSPLDLGWLDGLARVARRYLPPGGQLIVALDPAGGLVPQPAGAEPADLDRLEWVGLAPVGGRTCAVLRTGEGDPAPGSAATVLAAVHTAIRLATTAAGADGTRITRDEAKRILAGQLADQHRSEQALLYHLERLARRNRRPRPAPPPRLRAVIRNSRLGPPARWVLHRVRRVRARLRRDRAASA